MQHKRKLIRGLLNNKKKQFNYAILNIVVSILIILVINTIYILKFSKASQLCATNGEINSSDLAGYFTYLIIGSIVAIIISGGASFFFAILLTHRFYGPLVPILRHIEEVKKGNFEGRIHLRKTDELHELGEKLNEMTKKLAENHKP